MPSREILDQKLEKALVSNMNKEKGNVTLYDTQRTFRDN